MGHTYISIPLKDSHPIPKFSESVVCYVPPIDVVRAVHRHGLIIRLNDYTHANESHERGVSDVRPIIFTVFDFTEGHSTEAVSLQEATLFDIEGDDV
jgi:hypothetical protein